MIDLNRMLSPDGVYTASLSGVDVRSSDGIHVSVDGGELLQRQILPAVDRIGMEDEAAKARSVNDPEAADTPAAEVVVEAVPAAMALAPNAVGPNLGAELLLDAEARPGVESMRAGLLQAGPPGRRRRRWPTAPASSSPSRWPACSRRTATASSTS